MIVHIITGLSRGGAENALYRLLSQELNPARVRVVSLTDEGIFGERLRAMGIKVTCLHLHPRLPSVIKFVRLVYLLRRWRPRLVQTWMYHADLVGGVAGRLAGIPVCWGVRQSDFSVEHSKVATRLVAHICARVSGWVPSRIISCSQRAVEVHRALGYVAPFAVVHNGLDVMVWRPRPELRGRMRGRLGVPDDAFLFAHAGRADPQKNHSGLIEAFSSVQAACPNAWLLLCGSGLAPGDPYFESLPFTAEARQQVIALGACDDLPELWQGADAFVLSSIFGEAFPNVVAEAMACGLPSIVTDVGDAAEIVGEEGIVVTAGDVRSLAQAMLKLLHMPILDRQKLGNRAFERIQSRFTLERMANGFRQVWNGVLMENGSRCAD